MLKLKVLKEKVLYMSLDNVTIIKKDGTVEQFNPEKIKRAVSKSAARVLVDFTAGDLEMIIADVENSIAESNWSLLLSHKCIIL